MLALQFAQLLIQLASSRSENLSSALENDTLITRRQEEPYRITIYQARASYRIFLRGELFFYCRETMWLIDHSEGEGVGGGCAPSHAARSAETYCSIPFLTVRFTLWTNKGNAITYVCHWDSY